MQIDNRRPWREKLLKTLQTSYGRAPCFGEVFPLIADLVANPVSSLADYNVAAIVTLSRALGIDTAKFVLGSTLAVEGQATDLLIAIVRAVGGTAYLCGAGARGYQEDEKFAAAGLELIYQDFQHPVYPQGGMDQFVAGLSIIDPLMHCSFTGTAALAGARAPQSVPCSAVS
jgi:hypothetical protein